MYWKAKQADFRDKDVMGHVQHGRGGLGLAPGKPMRSKASVV